MIMIFSCVVVPLGGMIIVALVEHPVISIMITSIAVALWVGACRLTDRLGDLLHRRSQR